MVDKSLSRGLADRVLDEMKGLGDEYLRACGEVIFRIPQKRHAVKDFTSSLKRAGEVCRLTQIIGSHPKWRWAMVCAFIPKLIQGEVDDHNRGLAFESVRTYLQVDRIPDGRLGPPVLMVQEHALERMFQRLNVLNPAAVREEMHDAMCMSLRLFPASTALGLKQIVVPTRSGAFRCDVDEENDRLVARTWVPRVEGHNRFSPVIAVIETNYNEVGGENNVARDVACAPLDGLLQSIQPPTSLVSALAGFPWLRQPYSRRADPVGDVWENARQQANAETSRYRCA